MGIFQTIRYYCHYTGYNCVGIDILLYTGEEASTGKSSGRIQIIMILVAATYQHNPNIILLGNGNHISLLEYAAPQKPLKHWAGH